MVEHSTRSTPLEDPLEMLTINKGMKKQLKKMRNEKVEEAKHGERPLVIESTISDPGELFNQVLEKDEELKSLKKKYESSMASSEKYSQEITELKSRIKTMERDINEKQQFAKDKEKSMSELQKHIEDLERSRTVMEKELEELRQYRDMNEINQKTMDKLQATIDEMKRNKSTDKSEMSRVMQELDTAKKQSDKYNGEISKLKMSSNELRKEVAEKRKKISQLETKLSQANKESTNSAEMQQNHMKELEQMREQLQELKRSSNQEISRLKGQIDHLENENARISKYETSLIGSMKTKLSENEKSKEETAKKMNEMLKEHEQFKKMEEKLEKKEFKIKNLQQTLDMMQTQMKSMKRAYKKNVTKLRQAVESREEEIVELEDALETAPDLIIVEEEITMPEPVPVPYDASSEEIKLPSMKEITFPSEQRRKELNETSLVNRVYSTLLTYLTAMTLFSTSSITWMLPAFVALFGPLGAFAASKMLFKSNRRAVASAFYWMIPFLNVIVWFDFALTSRSLKSGDKKKSIDEYCHSLPFIAYLPFMSNIKQKSGTKK